LTILTFRWNHSLHGMTPYGFHVVNLVLHALVWFVSIAVQHIGMISSLHFSILFVYATKLMIPKTTTTVITLVGLLFAAHPIHTESVASIVVCRQHALILIFILQSG
jgi:hypothetical protein